MMRALQLWWAMRKATKPARRRAPTSSTLIAKRKELEEASLALLGTQSGLEYAQKMKEWHETRIARLIEQIALEETYLAGLEKIEEAAPATLPPEPVRAEVPFATRVHPFRNPETVAAKAINDRAPSLR